MTSNPWYAIAPPDAPLTQGDLLFDCPLICWREDAPDYAAEPGAEPPTAPFVAWRRLNVIVLTHIIPNSVIEQKRLAAQNAPV